MKYTVLVQRPDWIADPYGLDTYLAHVEADKVIEAQGMAREQAWEADNVDNDEPVDEDDQYNQTQAYAILAVFEDHLTNYAMED